MKKYQIGLLITILAIPLFLDWRFKNEISATLDRKEKIYQKLVEFNEFKKVHFKDNISREKTDDFTLLLKQNVNLGTENINIEKAYLSKGLAQVEWSIEGSTTSCLIKDDILSMKHHTLNINPDDNCQTQKTYYRTSFF
jgi:hypothetical protein